MKCFVCSIPLQFDLICGSCSYRRRCMFTSCAVLLFQWQIFEFVWSAVEPLVHVALTYLLASALPLLIAKIKMGLSVAQGCLFNISCYPSHLHLPTN